MVAWKLWRHDIGISGAGCYGRSNFKRNWILSATSALRRADFASLSVENTLGLKIRIESADFNQDISPYLRREKLRSVPHDWPCGCNDSFVHHIQNVLLVDSACAITSEINEQNAQIAPSACHSWMLSPHLWLYIIHMPISYAKIFALAHGAFSIQYDSDRLK